MPSTTNKNKQEEDTMECLKQKLTTILQANRFCAICLESMGKLWSVNTEFDIVIGSFSRKILLVDIIEYIFNNEGKQILVSFYLCSHCIEKSIQSYSFIYNAKYLSNILDESVRDLNLKTIDINNQLLLIDDHQTANVFIVLDKEHDEFKLVDISKTTEILAVETSENFFHKLEANKYHLHRTKTKANHVNSHLIANQTIIEDKSKADLQTLYLEPDIQSSDNEEDCHKDKDQIYLEINSPSTANTDQHNPLIEIEHLAPQIKNKHKGLLTFKCSTCKKVLPSSKSLLQHRRHCKKQCDHMFKCKVCGETFINQRSLNTHYESHAMVRCKICQFIVADNDLPEHVKINHEEYSYFCKSCSFFCYTAKKLEAHTRKNHSGPQCGLCFKLVKANDLKAHRCKFNCPECPENICIHYKYLVSYREQVQNNEAKIKCIDCDYVSSKREALLGHVNREHLDHHPFTCDHCKQQFFSRTALRYHINVFHMDKHICELCDQEFATKTTFENHSELCKCTEKEHKCDHCRSSFNILEDLANHVTMRHTEESFNCDLCKRKFLTDEKLHDHMFKVHNGVQVKRKRSLIKCPICDQKCSSKTLLLQHIKLHGPDARLTCKVCNEEFDGLRKLHYHIRKHDEDVIQCVNCKKVFTKTFFPHHTVYCNAGREPKERECTCEICGKVCKSDVQLKFHKKIHLDKVPCPICKKMTKPVYLRIHIKRMHSKANIEKVTKPRYTRNYKCEICDYRFARQAEVENHVNRFHLKIKPYQCDLCQKRFCGKERLREHLITHTTAKNCYCSVCNKKFENKSCLNQHMRRHTGVNQPIHL